MKRVNIRFGLKQRMNEIIGSDSGTEDSVPGLTPWSVQAAMLDNLRRIAAAVVGNEPGRPMRGMWISKTSSLSISISAGNGFTPNGDIILISTNITSNVDSADGTKYVYLRHKMAAIDGDVYEDGKKTGFIGKAGTQDIVYDDFAASKKDSVQSFVGDILTISPTIISENSDLIYIGSVNVLGADIVAVNNSTSRGLGPNAPNGKYRVSGLDVNGNSTFFGTVDFSGGDITFSTGYDYKVYGDLKIESGGKIFTTEGEGATNLALTVRDAAGTGTINLKFKNGIFIGTA